MRGRSPQSSVSESSFNSTTRARGRYPSVLALLGALVIGCGRCGEPGPTVEGPHPYVRCGEMALTEGRFGSDGVTFDVDGRTVRLAGASRLLVLAATDATPAALAGAPVLPTLVLGGFGRDEAQARALLEALGPRPALLLAGGEDEPAAIEAALRGLSGRQRVAHISGAHRLETPHGTFVILPGAPNGRYARGSRACGFSDADVAARASSLGPAEGERRWLLSWAAPSGGGEHAPDRGFGGVRVGSDEVATLARQTGARGGLFAWPRTTAGLASAGEGAREVPVGEAAEDLAVVVPLAGAATERFDGSLLRASWLVLELGPEGLRVVGE
ncbi:MAG: hypothetical protein KF901_07600 [Myxococcales bacterium]|nr:hypothetical protein [Myxococcales bacterium]